MESKEQKIMAGHLLFFSSGEYSDYGYNGHYVALKDITSSLIESIKNDVNAQAAKPEGWRLDKHEKFIARMISEGYLLSLTVSELHLGSYGDLSLEI